MASTSTELNRVRFAALDFDTHFDDLRARLQVKFAADFNDFALSSLGIMLLDLVSFGLDTLSFYLDRRATDAYLDTVRTRKGASRLARQLGYKMGPAIASSVDLSVALKTAVGFTCPVPKGFRFQGPNELVFEAAEEVSFPPGSGPSDLKNIPCYEGETFSESFVTSGAANQVFELRRVPVDEFIVLGSVSVLVNGLPWTESEFITFDATDQFEVGYNDDPPTLRFGDGVAGNIPAQGATVVVKYIASRGKAGQVAAGSIVDVVTPLVVNFTTIPLTVINPEPSIGGDDPETVEHVRAFAGRVFKSRMVAVTREDYEAQAGSYADPLFGRVAVAQAISSRSAASDLELQNRIISIRGAAEDPVPAVDGAADDAETRLATIDAQLTVLNTKLGEVAAATASIDTTLGTAITDARAVKNKAQEIATDAADIQAHVLGGLAAVDAIAPALTSQLTTADADAIKTFFNRINAEAGSSIGPAASTLQASADAQIASMGTAQDAVEDIGTDLVTAGTVLTLAEAARQVIATNVGPDTVTVGIKKDLQDIRDVVTLTAATIEADLQAIYDHVDRILAADCRANLITVPILARDAAGFYAAPSTSLVQSLQTYLDARKEVTQTVQVTSGAGFLVQAVVSLRVGVGTGFSEAVVATAVAAVLDGLLRGRRFGACLFLSAIVDAVLGVAGVVYTNARIDGYLTLATGAVLQVARLDMDGNLIIEDSEVVTKGSVAIATEPPVCLPT